MSCCFGFVICISITANGTGVSCISLFRTSRIGYYRIVIMGFFVNFSCRSAYFCATIGTIFYCVTGQIAVGAVIKARGLKLEALNGSDKVTDRSSRVKKMIASLALVENDLAEKGPVRVYIRVKDPEGVLLTNSTQRTFSVAGGEPMICSASREVDYEGKELEMGIYLNEIPSFVKGIYTIEAYTEQAKLGEAELMLR